MQHTEDIGPQGDAQWMPATEYDQGQCYPADALAALGTSPARFNGKRVRCATKAHQCPAKSGIDSLGQSGTDAAGPAAFRVFTYWPQDKSLSGMKHEVLEQGNAQPSSFSDLGAANKSSCWRSDMP